MSQLTFGQEFSKNDETKPSWYKGRPLSHSSLSTYQQCPQKWKFRYIDKIPEKPRSFFSFGKSVHTGLESLFANAHEAVPSLEAVLDVYRTKWIRDGYESPAQEKWFFKEGERILRGFYAKHSGDFKAVLKVEWRFSFEIEGVPLIGFIDRIDLTPRGHLSIVDYKTGKAFDKSRVRDDAQLTLYQMACRETLEKDVESLTLYHLNSLTPLTVPSHSSSLEQKVRDSVVSVARGITDQKFDPQPDIRAHCQWCDYVQICPAFAGKKIPLALTGKAAPVSDEDVDRFGKLHDRIRELQMEKNQLKEAITKSLQKSDQKELKGKYYSVKLKSDSDDVDVTPIG